MRFGLAVLSAVFCAFLPTAVLGLSFGISVYLVSYLLAKYAVSPDTPLGKRDVYMLGLGTYIFVWLALWVILYTFLMAPSYIAVS